MNEKLSGKNRDYEVPIPPFYGKVVDPLGITGYSHSFEEELPKNHKNRLPKTLGQWDGLVIKKPVTPMRPIDIQNG